MEKVFLDGKIREELGKNAVGRLRKEGFIPAVVYKGGGKAAAIKVGKKDLFKTLHTKAGENVIITLRIAKDKAKSKADERTAIIKEIQIDPVKDEIIHVDFNEISLTERLKVKVPVTDKGEAIGVKRDSGVLEHILWEVEIECLPTQIPEKLEVDVSNLEIGKDIFVKDIPALEGVKILADPEAIVFSVKPPRAEVVVEEAAPAAEEPEVIREKKPEAEGEEEAKEETPKEKAKEKKEEKEAKA
ncbi:MAG: 50S ribosomal protein L25 [Candidatus Omnitrophica bacterium CG07_land_8_20_14_0_80_42_15]|uniref:Large ribosomal subunit protein bL25 n=1 Tax=Candidatus Aquitaenariimonas noxiae TaxID=1974741 RepID=A0A2J0L4M9_9BACT|nr:MAG: 50S ribosomal protein L25 [Candidatus Omnitrophica bacterium CG07_land_8_20_14_0_80_42_15]